jgi:hypothetical protein
MNEMDKMLFRMFQSRFPIQGEIKILSYPLNPDPTKKSVYFVDDLHAPLIAVNQECRSRPTKIHCTIYKLYKFKTDHFTPK